MQQVTLTLAEIENAAKVGMQRRVTSFREGKISLHGLGSEAGRTADIVGAMGECAFAKWLGVPWAPSVGESDRLTGDVAGLQVRTTAHQRGCLILHERDVSAEPFVLMIGTMGAYRVAGWLFAHEGRQGKYWRTDVRAACYMVPQEDLRAPESLREYVAARASLA
jgi:hypothetical protein